MNGHLGHQSRRVKAGIGSFCCHSVACLHLSTPHSAELQHFSIVFQVPDCAGVTPIELAMRKKNRWACLLLFKLINDEPPEVLGSFLPQVPDLELSAG